MQHGAILDRAEKEKVLSEDIRTKLMARLGVLIIIFVLKVNYGNKYKGNQRSNCFNEKTIK